VNLDLAVIGNVAEFAKLFHEKADPGAGCPDHLRKRLLADLHRDRLRGAVLAEPLPTLARKSFGSNELFAAFGMKS
jgi:hypothetical protein